MADHVDDADTPEADDTVADATDDTADAIASRNDTTQHADDASSDSRSEPDTDTDTEVTGLESKVGQRPARDWKRYGRVGLVAAAFAGAFGLAGGLGWTLWQQHQVTQAGTATRDTAVDYAQVLTSIDANKLDENFAAVLNGATGDFKDMYTRSSMQLRQLLIDNKAAAHGVVVASAIQSESPDKVVVLLMVDQTVTNPDRPDPRVDRNRMKMTMSKVDNRWLASKVELP